jgi:GNAT superfamily N-acetyltransferase
MPIITVKLQTAVRRTFRVEQVAGMFDVPLGQIEGRKSKVEGQGKASHPKLCHELVAEVPGLDEEWTIGAIVGPSGSGKTTLAKAAFGDAIYRRRKWPRDRALIDCFGDMPVKLLTQALAAAGLGSPVAWLKPYRVLSTGEKFRADLFRSFLTLKSVVVFDEYSGALDRTVAKTASAAFARLLRSQETGNRGQETEVSGHSSGLSPVSSRLSPFRFVAVTCHRDVLPWLSPDWVVELGRGSIGVVSRSAAGPLACASGLCGSAGASPSRNKASPSQTAERHGGRSLQGHLVRGRPRKVGFRFRTERVPQMLWWQFEPYHYLAGGLASSASCYAAMWNGEPIGFCAVVACLGWKQTKRIQRLVVLPEFQGMGVGGKLLDGVAADQAAKGFRVTITASHPAVLGHCGRSENWQFMDIKKTGSTRQEMDGREIASSFGRAVAAFEFVCGGTPR